MPREGTRRRKGSHLYDILIVSIGQGRKTVSFRTSRLKLILLGILAFLVSVGITLSVLIYTPLAMYIPIPNPGLEEKYGRQIVETQERLNALARDILMVKDYNLQVRKALGEEVLRDSSDSKSHASAATVDNRADSMKGNEEEMKHLPSVDQQYSYDQGEFESTTPAYSVLDPGTESVRSLFPIMAPTTGFVTQGFDPARRHYGIDYAGKRGTPVFAAADGYVVFAGWTYDDGNMLIVSHGGGYMTVYKHNQSLLKNVHSVVKRGEPIGLLGTSGKTSLGPHLHFEVWKDGVPHDPNEFLLSPSTIQ